MDEQFYPLSITTNDSLFITFKTADEFKAAYIKNPGYFPFPPANLEPTPAPKNKKIFSEEPKIVKVEDKPVEIDDLDFLIDGSDAIKAPSTPILDIDRQKSAEEIERVKRKYTKRQ
jgi:hypothetical protein